MQIFSWADFGHTFLNLSNSRTSAYAPVRQTSPVDRRKQILFAREKIGDLQGALKTIQKNWRRSKSDLQIEAASTHSRSDLGLGAFTPSFMESTQEVHATETSFATHGPDWSGSSTAALTIDGEYDGAAGSGELIFRVGREGTIGTSNMRVEVFSPNGTWLQRISIDRYTQPGDVFTLDNGLIVSFGAGDLVLNDEIRLDVSVDGGDAANPDLAFNGTGAGDANLEYGLDVSAGTFEVNGTVINVAADDSINSVLAKITESAAGVNASYSTATELITLSHKTPGPGEIITIGNDTSGFLAATKLTGAVLVDGKESVLTTLMANVDAFSGVSGGDFLINGTAIAINPVADTLQNVLDRINASDAGVNASVDADGRNVTITSRSPSRDLVLDDNGRGFFAALDIATGTFEPIETGSKSAGMTSRRTRLVTEAMRDAASAINDLFGIVEAGQEPDTWLKKVRAGLLKTLTGFMEGGDRHDLARMGIKLDLDSPTGQIFQFTGKNRSRFSAAVGKGSVTVEDLLFSTGRSGESGFVGDLLEAARSAGNSLEFALDYKGLNVDTYA